jgi:long-chain fatty acid transport protein
MRAGICRAGVAVLVVASGAATVAAQTDIEVNGGVQFNFSIPGTRGMGMGGARVALEDNPAAGFTNPAALISLRGPALYVEGRHWEFTSLFPDRGRQNGTPTGIGLDTIKGIVDGEAKTRANGLSLAAISYPLGPIAVSAYYGTLSKFETTYQAQGAFTDIFRQFPQIHRYDLEITHAGASAAFDLKLVTLGVGLTRYQMKLSSLTERFDYSALCTPCDQVGQSFGPPNFAPGNVNNQQTQEGTDDQWGFTAAFAQKIGEKLRVSYAFRKGPRFRFKAVNRGGPEFNNVDTIFASADGVFRVPDTLSMGVTFRPTEAALFSIDYTRVRYPVMKDGFAFVLTYPPPGPTSENFNWKDAHEIHAGFEYVLNPKENRIALRLGGWYDPHHNMFFDGSTNIAAGLPSLRFPRRKDTYHGSAGLGILLAQNIELDAAVDVSKRITTASVSAAYRFGSD